MWEDEGWHREPELIDAEENIEPFPGREQFMQEMNALEGRMEQTTDN